MATSNREAALEAALRFAVDQLAAIQEVTDEALNTVGEVLYIDRPSEEPQSLPALPRSGRD